MNDEIIVPKFDEFLSDGTVSQSGQEFLNQITRAVKLAQEALGTQDEEDNSVEELRADLEGHLSEVAEKTKVTTIEETSFTPSDHYEVGYDYYEVHCYLKVVPAAGDTTYITWKYTPGRFLEIHNMFADPAQPTTYPVLFAVVEPEEWNGNNNDLAVIHLNGTVDVLKYVIIKRKL